MTIRESTDFHPSADNIDEHSVLAGARTHTRAVHSSGAEIEPLLNVTAEPSQDAGLHRTLEQLRQLAGDHPQPSELAKPIRQELRAVLSQTICYLLGKRPKLRFPRLGMSLVGNRLIESMPGGIEGAPAQFVHESQLGPPELPSQMSRIAASSSDSARPRPRHEAPAAS